MQYCLNIRGEYLREVDRNAWSGTRKMSLLKCWSNTISSLHLSFKKHNRKKKFPLLNFGFTIKYLASSKVSEHQKFCVFTFPLTCFFYHILFSWRDKLMTNIPRSVWWTRVTLHCTYTQATNPEQMTLLLKRPSSKGTGHP